MGRYLRKCKELGEEVVKEKATEMEEAAAAAAGAAGRKRKVYVGESELSTSSAQLKSRRLAVVTPESSASSVSSGNSSCETVGQDDALASCCSSNGSSELTKQASKFVDLEDNEMTVEFFGTSAGDSLDYRERRETSPLREDQAESVELASTAGPRASNSRLRSSADKMPSEAELEEFFAAAEKHLQKKFVDKYNYDIVKDQPVEGRYEWVQVQIKP